MESETGSGYSIGVSWYDVFSRGYDLILERLYRDARERLAAAIQVGPCQTIVDLACGTGQNFPHLRPHLASEGRLIGVDASRGMLARAEARARRAGWENVSLTLADAREVTASELGDRRIDCVVCALGLSVIPDWERVFAQTFGMLREGGQYLILDVHASRRVPQTRMVEWTARADLSRRVWEPLERESRSFERTLLPGSPHVHGGDLFIATGKRA